MTVGGATVDLAAHGSSSRLSWLRWAVPLTAVALLGLAMRAYVYRGALGVPDSDEAVVGLMARHILHGHLTTFYWGQAYGGTQEAILAAPLVGIFGDSWLAIRIVPIGLTAVAAVLLWRVAKRLWGEPAGTFTGALFWIWPPFVVFYASHAYAFYGTDVFYAALLLLLGLRVVERPDRLRVGLFGFVLGLAFWQTSQIVPLAVPLVAWVVWKQPRALRHLWLAVLLALVGAAPWIGYNLRHGWASLTLPSAGHKTYWHRLRIFGSPLLLMATGLRAPYSFEPIVGPAQLVDLFFVALVALFAFGLYKTFRGNAGLPYLVACAYPFLYAISPLTLNSREPRYLTVLTPVLALLVGQLAKTYWRGIAVLVVAGVVSVTILHEMNGYFRRYGTETPEAPRSLAPLVATLDRHGLNRLYANYWVAYALMYDTNERIIAAQNKLAQVSFANGEATGAADPYIRWPPYEHTVNAATPRAFLFFKDGIESISIVPVLERHGYVRFEAPGFVILAPPGTK